MKYILTLFLLSFAEGSSLWSPSRLRDSTIDFMVDHWNDGIQVKAFFKKSNEKVKFFIVTRNKNGISQLRINDNKMLWDSGFDFKAETKVLIHGFANSLHSSFNRILTKAYLERHPHNVLVVDWSALCIPPFYSSAIENTKHVGVRLAELLAWLVTRGLSMSRVHLVGHSVGAHIAGITGAHLKHLGSVRRITGLDPAKPMFELETEDNQLSSYDAIFVDCIHTCGGFLGISNPICSVDFYPNGGTNPQPGCRFDFFGICSHQRAYQYFAESIHAAESFKAVRCERMDGYSPTNCSSEADVVMGENIDTRSEGIYYLPTARTPPFSLQKSSKIIDTITKFSWYFL